MTVKNDPNCLLLFFARNLKATIALEADFVRLTFAGAEPIMLINLLRCKFLNNIHMIPIRVSTWIRAPTYLKIGNWSLGFPWPVVSQGICLTRILKFFFYSTFGMPEKKLNSGRKLNVLGIIYLGLIFITFTKFRCKTRLL